MRKKQNKAEENSGIVYVLQGGNGRVMKLKMVQRASPVFLAMQTLLTVCTVVGLDGDWFVILRVSGSAP